MRQLRSELSGGKKNKQDAAKGSLASGWVVPLSEGVDAATDASCTDGESRDSHRKREIGIRGT